MSSHQPAPPDGCDRRSFLQVGAAGLSVAALTGLTSDSAGAAPRQAQPAQQPGRKPTQFQVACMTLPYSQFPLQRALEGLRRAGYRYVAWGTSHRENGGKPVPVIASDAAPGRAKELAARCRDMGLEPVMMFSGIYPEAKNGLEVLTMRIRQAAAGRVPQVLTFGHTRGGNEKLWIERFRKLGPIGRDNGVLLVVKQHGGETGTGSACAKITRQVNDDGVRVNYDAGNVMDYLRLSPAEVIKDLHACADEVRSFCIKDHRDFPPPHQDCGPGLGEIDHYRLLHAVAFTGRVMPLCCENIFAPRVPRPAKPAGVDALARRAREFLELVIQGIQQEKR
ncbi:MAG: TIM barrel protein [Gemmataceae bacterium]|nr:TIM barrel protein [Gemmataceae bacterium]